jgi:tRNA pseudouridine55 synthase
MYMLQHMSKFTVSSTKSSAVISHEKAPAEKISGWICLDKPNGMSSNRAMIKVRHILGKCNKVGYIGTLDPFATGVLPIAIGEARKFIQYTEDGKKTYLFSIKFGIETDSLDKDGAVVGTCSKIPSENEVRRILPAFLGAQMQMPPLFSAIKVNGKRACDRVRNNEVVELSPRQITVYSLEMIDASEMAEASRMAGATRIVGMDGITDTVEPDDSQYIKIVCSKGTYIRSLARDIAKKLGTVAYVKSLRRLQSGFFSINNAITLEKLLELSYNGPLLRSLISVESPLDDIPALYLETSDVTRLQRGLQVPYGGKTDLISSNVRIFDKESLCFKGIGTISADGELKAARMCVY